MKGRVVSFKSRGEKESVAKTNDLRTGCSVPTSGIFRVMHDAHRLPQEVTLLENQSFPRCSKCSEPVYFKLVRSAPAAGRNPGFAVLLYELPELAEQEDQSLAG
jgi:hypothetical protein